jgi:hypothetical protein
MAVFFVSLPWWRHHWCSIFLLNRPALDKTIDLGLLGQMIMARLMSLSLLGALFLEQLLGGGGMMWCGVHLPRR